MELEDATTATDAMSVETSVEATPDVSSVEGTSPDVSETPLPSSSGGSPFDWDAWDGKTEGLGEQYHPMHARMSALHDTASSQRQSQWDAERRNQEAAINSLLLGDDSGLMSQHEDAIQALQSKYDASVGSNGEWESKFTAQAEQHQTKLSEWNEREDTAFKEHNAWLYEDKTPQATRDSVADLIGSGVHPFVAAQMAQAKPAYFEAYSRQRKGGANHDAASSYADMVQTMQTKANTPPPAPVPSSTASMGAARRPGRSHTRQRTMADTSSVSDVRDVVANRLAAQMGMS